MMYPLAGWTLRNTAFICAKCHPQVKDQVTYENGWWWFDTYHLDHFLRQFVCDRCEEVISNVI